MSDVSGSQIDGWKHSVCDEVDAFIVDDTLQEFGGTAQ